MQKILYNLALVLLNEHAKDNNLDISGTHLIRIPKKWIFQLVGNKYNTPTIQVQFFKNQTPLFTIIK